MAYAVGHVSGAHFNPAVTLGAAAAKRFEWKDVPAYIATQVVAGLVAGGVLYAIASGQDGFAPIAIGLGLTLIHLVSIPISNTSVNPARSTAVAFFQEGAAGQLWAFWLAPIVGAVIAGLTYSAITGEHLEGVDIEGEERVADHS